MLLGLSAFRSIKPVNSIDDYIAGTDYNGNRTKDGLAFLSSLLKLITSKEMSVTQMALKTGKSRPAVQRRMNTQLKRGVVTSVTRSNGINKPSAFYLLKKVA